MDNICSNPSIYLISSLCTIIARNVTYFNLRGSKSYKSETVVALKFSFFEISMKKRVSNLRVTLKDHPSQVNFFNLLQYVLFIFFCRYNHLFEDFLFLCNTKLICPSQTIISFGYYHAVRTEEVSEVQEKNEMGTR